MPLTQQVQKVVHDYCLKDLPGDLDWHINQFDFIDNKELRKRLGRAFYSARYMGKLMEGLRPGIDEKHSFLKFQIAQYAGIYEGVIVYVLWEHYSRTPQFIDLTTHKIPVRAGSIKGLRYEDKHGTDDAVIAVIRTKAKEKTSISFKHKLACAVALGLVEQKFQRDLEQIYELRNLAHIEAEAKKLIEVELKQAQLAYWRVQPFLEKIQKKVADEKAAKAATFAPASAAP